MITQNNRPVGAIGRFEIPQDARLRRFENAGVIPDRQVNAVVDFVNAGAIFAGSGVGKTTLLSMLSRSQGFDTVVTALVGERGRDVREHVEDVLAHNRKRAITVVSSGDESTMIARFEDTPDLRLMGGYQPGREPELDHAVERVPRIYDALRQSPQHPASTDAFRELSEMIKGK